jgi:hypothetical protein
MIESSPHRPPGRIVAMVLLLALAGCVAEGRAGKAAVDAEPGDPKPGLATYACEDQTSLVVDNRVTQVTVTDGEGDVSILPAAPAEQRSRYGVEGLAIVLDGDDALFMKGRHEPVNCRR